jgi:LacI family transcriptional regulator
MAEKHITIKDIALHLGVSTGTVDRALHNRGNVSPSVKEMVLSAAKELGYEPNIAARTLANRHKKHRIAVLFPDFRTDLYWAQPKEGVEHAAKDASHYGVTVDFFFFPMFSASDFLQQAKKILQHPPDALLFAPVFAAESQHLIREAELVGIPLVAINSQLENSNVLSYIGQDSYQSGVLAGRLLNFGLSSGDHAIVLNLDKEVANAKHLLDKQLGFRHFFEKQTDKKIEVHYVIEERFDNPSVFKKWVFDFFNFYPDIKGVFVTNSRAWKLVEALTPDLQKRLKIVGFDLVEPNIKLLNENKIPFIINQNAWQQGYLGVLILVHYLIFHKKPVALQYLPLDIVVKENLTYYLTRTLEIPSFVLV